MFSDPYFKTTNYNDPIWWVIIDKRDGLGAFLPSPDITPDGTEDFPYPFDDKNPDPRTYKAGTYEVKAGPVTMWEAGDILIDMMADKKEKQLGKK